MLKFSLIARPRHKQEKWINRLIQVPMFVSSNGLFPSGILIYGKQTINLRYEPYMENESAEKMSKHDRFEDIIFIFAAFCRFSCILKKNLLYKWLAQQICLENARKNAILGPTKRHRISLINWTTSIRVWKALLYKMYKNKSDWIGWRKAAWNSGEDNTISFRKWTRHLILKLRMALQ